MLWRCVVLMKKRGFKQKAKGTVISCTLTERHVHREVVMLWRDVQFYCYPTVLSVVQPVLLSWALKSLMTHIVYSTTSSAGVLLHVVKGTAVYFIHVFKVNRDCA